MPVKPLLALIAAVPILAQDVTPTFRSTTELVLLDVQVVQKKTKTSTATIRQQDLRVFEDDVPQEITVFSRDQLPLSIVLLFDLTDSVRSVLKRLGEGAMAALSHLKAEDEVAVMEYSSTARLVDGFTTDRQRTVSAIESAARDRSGEAAFFNEAVYQAAEQLRSAANPASRRVVIWLTDNLANVPAPWVQKTFGKSLPPSGPHTEAEAFRALYESGAVVAPLLKKSAMWLPLAGMEMAVEGRWRSKYPPGDAYKYAERTGGQAVKLGGKAVDERLADLIDDLRSRYTIGYRPSVERPTGTFCKVRVELSPGAPLRASEWSVLATAGYYRLP